MKERETLGKPEEERAASSSTQSASGLGGGTPEARPSEGHGESGVRPDPMRHDEDQHERQREGARERARRAPGDRPDNSADDGAVRTDF